MADTTEPGHSGLLASQAAPDKDEPFRFFDNREKYLLFVTTTSETSELTARIGRELVHLTPKPPAMYLFDAGTGNGTVLSQVLRQMHREMPTVPVYAAGKEISAEDARLTLNQLPDRLAEHPETVVVLTNMFYAEAPWLHPHSPANQAMPGVVERAALASLGVRLGVGASLRFLRKNTGLVKMMGPSSYDLRQLLDPLVDAFERYGVCGVHLYPFNQMARTAEWRSRLLAAPS